MYYTTWHLVGFVIFTKSDDVALDLEYIYQLPMAPLITVLCCFVNLFAICLCVHRFQIYQNSPTIIRLCFMLFNDAFTVIILCTSCWWIMLTFTSVSTKSLSVSRLILQPSLHQNTIIKVLICTCCIFLRLFVLTYSDSLFFNMTFQGK